MEMKLKGKYYSNKDIDNPIIEVELKRNKKYDAWIRPGTSDSKMLKESYKDYSTINCKDKIVLDLGANIGGFTNRAISEGAQFVTAFEPDEFNFNLLTINSARHNVELVRAAVIDIEAEFVTFNMSGSGNSACSGTVNKHSRTLVNNTVPARSFESVLNEVKPDLIKMDVEGAEFDLLDSCEIPECVKDIAIEFHCFKKENKEKLHRYLAMFDEWELISKETQIVFNKPSIILVHYSRK